MEKREPFHIVDRNEIGMVNTNNSMAVPQKTENRATICCCRKKMNLKCIKNIYTILFATNNV